MSTVLVSANLSNPSHSITRRQQQAGLRRIKRRQHKPHIIVVQEAHASLRAPLGYRKYGGHGGVSELAIFVRKDIRVTDHGWKKSVSGVAGHWPDRGLVWVRLADGTVPICVHPNSRIDWGGAPLRGEAWRVTEHEHFPDVDAEVRRHQEAGDAPVVVGDWNIDRRADRRRRDPEFPAQRMHRLGMAEAIYQGASLGTRAVDRGFYDAARIRLVSARLMRKLADRYDHRPLRLEMRRR